MSNETELSDIEICMAFDGVNYSQEDIVCSDWIERTRAVIAAAFAKRDESVEPMDANHWAEPYRLREDAKGPSGFATWRDAAVHERLQRVALEQRAAVEQHLRTRDGKIILFPGGANVLLVDDDGMELVSVYSDNHTRYLDVYEQSFVRAALNSNTHPNTDDAEWKRTAETWKRRHDMRCEAMAKLTAERDALMGQVSGLRELIEHMREHIVNYPDEFDVSDELWLPFIAAIKDTATIAAAHDARVRREACPSCGDSPEHEWVIITPEGKRFTGNTRFEAMNAETSSRIPATVQLANVMKANEECESEHQAELARVRDLAINECAIFCEGKKEHSGYWFADNIRALKHKPVGE